MITLEIEITEEQLEDSEQLQEQFQRMIQERNQFQNELYDFLVNPLILNVPEDFWEPVTVKFDKVHELEDIIGENECTICLENHLNFKKTSCCGQKICNGCCFKWFETSVRCPYCSQDIREFDLKNTQTS